MKHFIYLLLMITISLVGCTTKPSVHQDNTLEIIGESEISTKPNQVVINASIESVSKSATTAASENAKRTDSIIKYLKATLPEKNAVVTKAYNLNPVYEYNRDKKKSELTGYRVSNQLVITSHKLEQIGELLDTLAKMQVSQINNLEFSHDNPADFMRDALHEAINNGMNLAEDIAKTSHIQLAELKHIQPLSASQPRPVYKTMMMADAGNRINTPIESGDVKFNAQIKLIYATRPN